MEDFHSGEIRIVTLIQTDLLRRGNGTENNPIRIIRQLWDMDGNLIIEYDPFTEHKFYDNTIQISDKLVR